MHWKPLVQSRSGAPRWRARRRCRPGSA
jgi:hypothetical protein